MGQLRLASPGNVPSSSRQMFEGEARARRDVKPNGHSGGARTGINAHLPSAQHSGGPRAAKQFSAGTLPTGERNGQPTTGQASPALSFLSTGSGIRALVAALILIALVPNLTLAAIFWLGVINAPWSKPAAQALIEDPAAAVEPATPTAVLTTPATLNATAGTNIAFPIALDGTDGVPPRSVIAISGLPRGSSFSDGRPYGDTEWNLKSDEIGDLHLSLPASAAGESKLTIELLSPDESVIADSETLLEVTPDQQAAPAPSAPPVEAASGDVRVTAVETTVIPSDGAQPSHPAPMPLDDAHVKWVTPSAFVNLRDGPSSSSSVIGVIAKGAKVAVIDQKRGWVRVNDPETSKSGWIYMRNAGGPVRSRHRPRRPPAPAQSAQTSTSETPLQALDQLLSSP